MNAQLSELTQAIRSKTDLTAVGIGVAVDGSEPTISVSGTRQHKHTTPVSASDKWHIGSVTKSMTSTLIAHMVEKGVFDFTTPLNMLLSDVELPENKKGSVTLADLLTHTAGIPANFPRSLRNSGPLDGEDVTSYRGRLISTVLSKHGLADRDTATFKYSNLGYAIAGYIAEKHANCSFESLMTKEIFSRYGMDSAGFGAPQGPGENDQPMGHTSLLWFRRPANPFSPGITDNGIELSAAGRAHMELRDLIKFGSAHLRGYLNQDQSLSEGTWSRLHTPIQNNYACGWVIENHDWAGGPMIWHNGSNTFWYALLLILPRKSMVLGFVTNNGAVGKAQRAFFQAAMQLAS